MPPRSLNDNAKTVVVKNTQPPESCKYIGPIVSEEGWTIRNFFTSNENLTISAFNTLRNKAIEQNANFVRLFDQQNNNVTLIFIPLGSDNVLSAVGYKCPLNVIQDMSYEPPKIDQKTK